MPRARSVCREMREPGAPRTVRGFFTPPPTAGNARWPDLCSKTEMTQSEREEAQVERAERTHRAVMETMAREKPGLNSYTWRDRYVILFQRLWENHQQSTRGPDAVTRASNSDEAAGSDHTSAAL
jgi:hypothetical protein